MMNNKYKVVALFGEAGSGKDYILKKIMETDFGKNNFSKIISFTTRPPREDEKNGIQYYFLSTHAELTKKDLIECTIFRDWWYGTSIDNLNINKINIGIFNISGINQLINEDYQHRIECLPIKISCYDKIRLLRQLNREIDPNCFEIVRRFSTDYRDFLNIPFEYKVIENNTNEIQPILEDIKLYIKEKWAI